MKDADVTNIFLFIKVFKKIKHNFKDLLLVGLFFETEIMCSGNLEYQRHLWENMLRTACRENILRKMAKMATTT